MEGKERGEEKGNQLLVGILGIITHILIIWTYSLGWLFLSLPLCTKMSVCLSCPGYSHSCEFPIQHSLGQVTFCLGHTRLLLQHNVLYKAQVSLTHLANWSVNTEDSVGHTRLFLPCFHFYSTFIYPNGAGKLECRDQCLLIPFRDSLSSLLLNLVQERQNTHTVVSHAHPFVYKNSRHAMSFSKPHPRKTHEVKISFLLSLVLLPQVVKVSFKISFSTSAVTNPG